MLSESNKKLPNTVLAINIRRDGKAAGFLPDFNITVYGEDIVDVIAQAQLKGAALYYYNLERDVVITLKATYQEALSHCKTKNSFVTYISLTP